MTAIIGGDRSRPAAPRIRRVLLSPGRQALWFAKHSNRLHARGRGHQATLVSLIGRWLTGIEIEPGARIGRNFQVWHGMGIVIGRGAVIGDDCRMLHGVTLGSVDFDDIRDADRSGYPTLGNRVTVFAGATLVGPITVGDGSIIAANSVVTQDVPPGVMVGGAPAKIIKEI